MFFGVSLVDLESQNVPTTIEHLIDRVRLIVFQGFSDILQAKFSVDKTPVFVLRTAFDG